MTVSCCRCQAQSELAATKMQLDDLRHAHNLLQQEMLVRDERLQRDGASFFGGNGGTSQFHVQVPHACERGLQM